MRWFHSNLCVFEATDLIKTKQKSLSVLIRGLGKVDFAEHCMYGRNSSRPSKATNGAMNPPKSCSIETVVEVEHAVSTHIPPLLYHINDGSRFLLTSVSLSNESDMCRD